MDQKVQKINLPRPPLPCEKNVPASVGTDGSPKAATYMAAKTIRWVSLARCGSLRANRQLCWQAEATRRWPSKTISGSKSLLPRPCKSGSSIPMEDWGSLHMNGWVYPKTPLCWAQYRGICCSSTRCPPLKPTCKCKVKVPRTQESMMASEARSMLSWGTIEAGP